MAEVRRRAGREGGRFIALTKRTNRGLSRIDGKLSVGSVLEGALLNLARKACAVNTAQLHDKEISGGDYRKCQLPLSVTVARESLRERRNWTGHVERTVRVNEKYTCSSKRKNIIDSLERGLPHASGLDMDMPLEVSHRDFREFTDSIQDMSGCKVASVNCESHLCDWLDSRDLSTTEAQSPKSGDCQLLLSDICSQKPVHASSCPKRNNFLTSVTHLTNHQQQRSLFTLRNLAETQWNYFVKHGCSGAMSFARTYSWHGKNSSSAAPPLYRSRTAYYDILRVSPNATQTQIKTAYYKQSFTYHPDRNSGSEEATQRFSEISEAYTVLGSIALRRKYDRGILSQTDVQGAGKPSAKETRSSSPPGQQHKKARYTHTSAGEKIFDFDAFYRAHYGEQLQRERELRLRRQKLREELQKEKEKWKAGKMTELVALVTILLTVCIFASM